MTKENHGSKPLTYILLSGFKAFLLTAVTLFVLRLVPGQAVAFNNHFPLPRLLLVLSGIFALACCSGWINWQHIKKQP